MVPVKSHRVKTGRDSFTPRVGKNCDAEGLSRPGASIVNIDGKVVRIGTT